MVIKYQKKIKLIKESIAFYFVKKILKLKKKLKEKKINFK